jgi:N-acetylglucosamine kinase-like BadF-type ATPase
MDQGIPAQEGGLALGLDAGGTRTRWALAKPDGSILTEGHVRGFSAVELGGPGQSRVAEILEELARAVLAHGRPIRAHAGLTGFGTASEPLIQLLAAPLGLPLESVTAGSDIETAYLDLFAPGEGYLVYSGTGSVAAFIDPNGSLHRAGGRGNLIDDGGGGFWIAREALRHIWRAEDERPGCWQDSPMAHEVFALLGGPDWSSTRQYVYAGDRGAIGRLALAVARAAERDAVALGILREAGKELARLGRAMIGRFGPRPVTLSGRAASLHPVILDSMRASLGPVTTLDQRPCCGHHAAARLALRATAKDLKP